MSKIIDSAKLCVEPIIQAHNMELVDIEYKNLYGTMTLIIYIDKEGGISLSDCEEIHNAIDAPLDEQDPTEGQSYNLNVSSPGLDRPFKREKDYLKNINTEVEVSLFKPIEKLKKFKAILKSYSNGEVELEVDKKIIKLNTKDISVMKAVIKF